MLSAREQPRADTRRWVLRWQRAGTATYAERRLLGRAGFASGLCRCGVRDEYGELLKVNNRNSFSTISDHGACFFRQVQLRLDEI